MLLESLAHDAGLSPSTDDEVVGAPLKATRQPPSDRGLVQGSPGDRGPARLRAGGCHRAAPYGHDRPGQHALARPATPQPADVGTAGSVPPADNRGRGRGPQTTCLRGGERRPPRRGQGHAHLRARCQRRRQRHPRHGVPRGSSSRCPCTATTPGGARQIHTAAFAVHRRAIQLLRVVPAGTCGLQGACITVAPGSCGAVGVL